MYDWVAFAHDCSSPGDCEETAGYNSAVAVVGGVIAVIVGVMTSGMTPNEPLIDDEITDEEIDIESDEETEVGEGNEDEEIKSENKGDETGEEESDNTDDETDDDDDLRVEDEEQKRLEDERIKEEERLKAEALAAVEAKRQLEIQKQQEEREKALQKLKEIEKEKIRREKYINKLCKKYNTTPDELRNVLRKNIKMSQAEADSWNSYDKKLAIAETAAKMTLIAADTAIDGLANATGPMGRGIRAGYKITKSVASTMATKGVSGSSLASGLVTGGADAATDFIDNPYLKAGTTIVGETLGGAITDGKKGAVDGFIKGVFTAGVNEGTGRLAGPGYGNDMKKMIFNKDGTATVTIKSAGKWISKTISGKNAIKFANGKISKQFTQSAIKGASSTLNEMGIKPSLGL